jgi:hypothetical protein
MESGCAGPLRLRQRTLEVAVTPDDLLAALESSGWHRGRAAKVLGISRGAFWRRVTRWPELHRLACVSLSCCTRRRLVATISGGSPTSSAPQCLSSPSVSERARAVSMRNQIPDRCASRTSGAVRIKGLKSAFEEVDGPRL